jgi:hypothetical protein
MQQQHLAWGLLLAAMLLLGNVGIVGQGGGGGPPAAVQQEQRAWIDNISLTPNAPVKP